MWYLFMPKVSYLIHGQTEAAALSSPAEKDNERNIPSEQRKILVML